MSQRKETFDNKYLYMLLVAMLLTLLRIILVNVAAAIDLQSLVSWLATPYLILGWGSRCRILSCLGQRMSVTII